MRVYRPSFDLTFQSPTRRVFGIHPTQNKILVHIDLCTLINDNTQPNFDLLVDGKDILNSDTSAAVGKIESFSIPPTGNINPTVTLKPDLPIDSSIKKITIPTTISVGDIVKVKGFTGKILPSLQGNTSLIDTFPYPLDFSKTISAYRIEFIETLQLEDIGSPIIMGNGSTLGMLLTNGLTVFVFPSSLI
jgi:hypothetical protein